MVEEFPQPVRRALQAAVHRRDGDAVALRDPARRHSLEEPQQHRRAVRLFESQHRGREQMLRFGTLDHGPGVLGFRGATELLRVPLLEAPFAVLRVEQVPHDAGQPCSPLERRFLLPQRDRARFLDEVVRDVGVTDQPPRQGAQPAEIREQRANVVVAHRGRDPITG